MQEVVFVIFLGVSIVLFPFYVARGMQMVKSDVIFDGLRQYVSTRSAFFTQLLGCMWCSSVWFGFGGFFLVGLASWLATFAHFLLAILPLAPIWALASSEIALFGDRLFDRWLPDEMTSIEWASRYMDTVKTPPNVIHAAMRKPREDGGE